MKIGLFAENYYPYICGVNPILRTLLHRLKDAGHEVTLVCFNVRRMYEANKDNPQIKLIKGLKLPRFITENMCTTIVLNHKKAAQQLKDVHFDIVHIHGEFSIALTAVEYAKQHNVPIVYTWHSLWRDIMFKTAWVAGYVASLYVEHHNIKRIVRYCDVYTVPSMKVYKRATTVINSKKLPILLPSGIQIEPFLERDEKRIADIRYQYNLQGKKIILFLGRVSREKRALTIIRYMKRTLQANRNIVVLIVGTGYYIKHMQKWAKRHHLRDSLIFTGPVMNRETASFYQAADVFVSGSKMETQGLTYIEAMTSGTVVLAQNDTVLEGVIKDGENGFIYNKRDEFVKKLEYILANDLYDVKKAAREKGLEYSSDIYLEKLQKIYQEVIKNHNYAKQIN